MLSPAEMAMAEWLGDAAVFVAKTEVAARRLDAAGGAARMTGLALKALAGSIEASAWLWYKKLGGGRSAFDEVMRIAREA